MLNKLQNPLSLLGRVLLALVFIPAGWGKLTGLVNDCAQIVRICRTCHTVHYNSCNG